MSTDPEARINYGPYTPGFKIVKYNDIKAIEEAITENTCAVIIEPIQGEAGVYVPYDGYLKDVRALCTNKNILMIADEVQTGFCRTGKKFAVNHEDVKPDIMTLGKALGGGVIPVSAVVADKEVMLNALEDENMAENAETMGQYFREEMRKINCSKIVTVRGKGLLNAVLFEDDFEAWDVCLSLRDAGLLAKQTHGNIIRFAPPLVITREEMDQAIAIIKEVFENIK